MGGPRRRWSQSFPRGSVVQHPSVLELVRRGDPGTRPRLHNVGGQPIVAYSSTRVFMKREAWEMLPTGGILVQWVRPTDETPWALAMTLGELQNVFGEIQQSESWEEARCYHFPKVPAAARSFRVLTADAPEPPDMPSRSARRPGSMTRDSEPAPRAEPPPIGHVVEMVVNHLRTYGSATEAELSSMAGGARRYRLLRRHLTRSDHPIRFEPTPQGLLWRWTE